MRARSLIVSRRLSGDLFLFIRERWHLAVRRGECLVRFSLTARGVPFNVVADCSHRGFESEARRSVEKAEFLPGILKGQPAESHGFSYPLQFRLSEE
ncbi:MAG TPA: hypothetical protein DCG65_06680 [Hyphomonas atlantica]|uniref:TonB C-terminal domain-containing protein n=1 Tax=Hyphomonas atlantica TaxID=1280948 RepID=A0A3B9L054_9PROT|nr:hypothetical protein [Hyphomonas atlantica]